ncbi:hypothetical protein ES332_A13G200300v1 [Gossypium tomentosum]|uniref:Uncharacterized protein n=1 Tax=Gossypium tomentosum TaxID=34277 RepID=A0A5D2MMK7_GOSTO|nr:hypothetical protein ES332_A13G200300v1 [Gossypium tomentosum]
MGRVVGSFPQNKTLQYFLNSLNLPCKPRRHRNMLPSLLWLQMVPRDPSTLDRRSKRRLDRRRAIAKQTFLFLFFISL